MSNLFDFATKVKDHINKELGEVTFWGYGIDAEDPYRKCDVNTRYMTIKDHDGKLFRITIQTI